MISQYCFFVSRRVFWQAKVLRLDMTRGTQAVCTFSLSGTCSHRGHPSHPTLSSWPAFKSPGTHSAFVCLGHFPSLLLTASYFISPKTLNISCSFPPSWGWRQSLRDFSGCPPPHPLRCLHLCLSRPPSLLSWRGAVHVPVEGCQLCLLKIITLVSPTGFPTVPAICPPSPTLALFRSLSILEKVPPPDVPVASCLRSFVPSAVHSVTLFVNSSWSSCSNLQSPASYFLFPYCALLFSLARTTV